MAEKLKIVLESFRGPRQVAATARRYSQNPIYSRRSYSRARKCIQCYRSEADPRWGLLPRLRINSAEVKGSVCV